MDTPIIPSDTGFNDSVYEPAEDSFLLLDALEEDLIGRRLAESKDDDDSLILALEVGCGSGIISTALAKAGPLQSKLPVVFATDINRNACLLTQKTAQANLNIEGSWTRVQTILVDGSRDVWKCFREPFDLIVCNPPYVPVIPGENKEDTEAGVLEKSWAGGPDGNEFILPFLSNIGSILSPSGVLYMLLSSWNNPEMLVESVAKPNGLQGSLVIKRAAGRERLSVWRFCKSLDIESKGH
jgi:release factor glutamine methyltransferase